jgi:hypothetical protein
MDSSIERPRVRKFERFLGKLAAGSKIAHRDPLMKSITGAAGAVISTTQSDE